MPRKVNDACMFCTEEEPCPSHQPRVTTAKKSSSRTKRSVSDSSLPGTSLPSPSSVPVAPPLDVKAAMKAAVTTQVTQHVRLEREQQHLKIDTETEDCLNILLPILHPDEIERHNLNSHENKVARWRFWHGRR